MKTHYDTLKVTQDAPVEVINAAYKALALIYHPDRNINNPSEAISKMQEVNVAYTVLSDTQKRADHDAWINSHDRRSNRVPLTGAARRQLDPTEKDKAAKASADASKWAVWADKTAREAKDAQVKLEKAQADLAKAKDTDRPKWETWVAKLAHEAKEAKARADEAALKAEQAKTGAVDAQK